jgi:diguanylate cyclase (GGDEF)-like protein
MLDIDHFKRVNDTFGHAAGDEVLRAVATVLEQGARTGDLVARIGGEEFVVIHVSPSGRPHELAERLRAEVAAIRLPGELASLRVTLSAGVAARSAGESFEHALGRADGACYAAKEWGRDRTVVADPMDADERWAPRYTTSTATPANTSAVESSTSG